MRWFRRLIASDEPRPEPVLIAAEELEPTFEPAEVPEETAPAALACPSCGALLSPPPTSDRRCPHCRQRIVVRHVEGRTVLLTEAALEVFKAEQQRTAEELAQASARDGWLRLARRISAPPARIAKLAAAPISSDVVDGSRALYLATAERAIKAAHRDRRWGDIGRIRHEQAKALYDERGAPVSPTDEIAGLQRDGMVAVLRSLQTLAKEVELVGARCCPACKSDNGKTFKIVDELRLQRLPHTGCPLGLCGCDWWPAMAEPKRKRRRTTTTRAKVTPTGDAGPDSWSGSS